ncbi:MAG: cobalamin biosynthesis protein [Chloroflexi bacterium]|nr:cobalamin biosynthesis protein [Chloroflexota bacterium]
MMPAEGAWRHTGKLVSVALTRQGSALSLQLHEAFPELQAFIPARFKAGVEGIAYTEVARSLIDRIFPECQGLILFMALGAAVRLIAPHLRTKWDDPAVVVVDEAGRFAISMLSGHHGGANALALLVAASLGATPVITTASDSRDLPALDLLGQEEGWKIETEPAQLKLAAAALLDDRPIIIFQDAGSRRWMQRLPPHRRRECQNLEELPQLAERAGAAILITDQHLSDLSGLLSCPTVIYRPPSLVAGIGCSRDAPAAEIERLLQCAFEEAGLAPAALWAIATLDRKQNEPGLVAVARQRQVPLLTYTAAELAAITPPTPSDVVQRAVGTAGVCEPAALLASKAPSLVLTKRKSPHATVALARRKEMYHERA